MRIAFPRPSTSVPGLLAWLLVATTARSAEPSKLDKPGGAFEVVSLLDAQRSGQLTVKAEGMGDGRMVVSVRNKTHRRLRVILPPGLVAVGASGQFGGGGGIGGGGLGGGQGGLGGKAGGGVGGGRLGGNLGGQNQRLTLPSQQGLMMLANLIFTLVEPTETWDRTSFARGTSGFSGRGIGGGGVGGGPPGGRGFRSVDVSAELGTTLEPAESKRLATKLIRIGSDLGESSSMPVEGEPLRLGMADDLGADDRTRKALEMILEGDVPRSIGQLALARVGGLEWVAIEDRARGWANADELAIARRFVDRLDGKSSDEGAIYWDVLAREDAQATRADALRATLRSRAVLGIVPGQVTAPNSPDGPSIAVRVAIAKAGAHVSIEAAGAKSGAWEPVAEFVLPETKAWDEVEPDGLAGAIAEGVLGRLVRFELIRGKSVNGNTAPDRVRIVNASPLVLHGLRIVGSSKNDRDDAPAIRGMALAPRRALTLTVSAKTVQELGLRSDPRATAANFGAY